MAERKLTKEWSEYSEAEQRRFIWNAMEDKNLEFKKLIDKDTVNQIIMDTKDLDFNEQSDEIRKRVLSLYMEKCKHPGKIRKIRIMLKMEN